LATTFSQTNKSGPWNEAGFTGDCFFTHVQTLG
jgi:hypothetical protein